MADETTPKIAGVHPGQVWVDNDARGEGLRTLRVDEVGETHAVCTRLTDFYGAEVPAGRAPTRIRLDRFKPTSTGYRLVKDVGLDISPT